MASQQFNTLGDLSISPKEIATDYFEGDDAYEQYVELLDCANSGGTPADYAKLTGVTRSSDAKEYNARHQAMTSFLQGHCHMAIQGLIALRALGVLEEQKPQQKDARFDPRLLKPFDINSRHFELLAMLSAFEFWTGSIGLQKTTPNRTVKNLVLLNRDAADSKSKQVVDEFIKKLKDKGICTPFEEKRTKRAGRVTVPIARLITLMNDILGRKSQMDHVFPEIIASAYRSLTDGESEAERQEAFRILQDFILAFFIIRAAHRQDHGYGGWIVAHRNEQIAQQRSALFQEILKRTRFDNLKYSLNLERNRCPDGHRSSYVTRVTFHDVQESDIQCIREEFRERVGEIVPG